MAPCREHTSKALMYDTRSQGIWQFYLHTPRSSANGMNHTCLCLQPKLVLIHRPRRDGRLSWPWVAGWLHTEISVRHRELNPDRVAHLSTNRDGHLMHPPSTQYWVHPLHPIWLRILLIFIDSWFGKTQSVQIFTKWTLKSAEAI